MKTIQLFLLALIFLAACNKEKSFMKNITANWNIKNSSTLYTDSVGQETTVESVDNAGSLVIYDEDPDNPSKEEKLFNLIVYDNAGDTLISKIGGKLITDERNKRLIMTKTLSDSTYFSDIIWTIDQNKKNRQTWTCFGVDSVLFYPTNNHNPGAASNWVEWRIELKKD